MNETILEFTPEKLRAIAGIVDNEDTAELLKVANALEESGSFSVVRPAYKVTWVNSNRKET